VTLNWNPLLQELFLLARLPNDLDKSSRRTDRGSAGLDLETPCSFFDLMEARARRLAIDRDAVVGLIRAQGDDQLFATMGPGHQKCNTLFSLTEFGFVLPNPAASTKSLAAFLEILFF